jgi:hypothetical protein
MGVLTHLDGFKDAKKLKKAKKALKVGRGKGTGGAKAGVLCKGGGD